MKSTIATFRTIAGHEVIPKIICGWNEEIELEISGTRRIIRITYPGSSRILKSNMLVNVAKKQDHQIEVFQIESSEWLTRCQNTLNYHASLRREKPIEVNHFVIDNSPFWRIEYIASALEIDGTV